MPLFSGGRYDNPARYLVDADGNAIDPNNPTGSMFQLGTDQGVNVGTSFLPKFLMPDAPTFNPGFVPPEGTFTQFQGTEGIDPSILNLIRQSAERERVSGVIPDDAAFEASMAAQLDEIFARAGVSREQLAADLSARGIGGAGEIPRYLLRDIQGPAVRAAATVSAGAKLDFAKFSGTQAVAQEQLLQGARGQLLDAAKTNAQLASVEAQLGFSIESQERLEANRNDLQKAIHDDNISLEVYRTQLMAQLQEYLAKMTWLTQTDVANISADAAEEMADAKSKEEMWKAIGGIGIAIAFSDANLKEDIEPTEVGLTEINQLAPVKFSWISGEGDEVGLIAQEVKEVIPDAVALMPDGENLGVRPNALIAALIGAVKELSAKVEKLEARA